MSEKKRILAIIPAHNEEESLPNILREIAEVRPDIDVIVVDDGSTDSTVQVAQSMGMKVIILPINLGVGGAVQTGLQYAYRHGYDIAFQIDADGQHRPDQVGVLLEPILQGEADMVMGSRFLETTGYKVSIFRGFLMWMLRTITSYAYKGKVTDTTSGFRAYNRPAIEYMIVHCSVDFPDVEAIVGLTRNGFRFKEVSTLMRERVAGKSMFTPFRAAYFVTRLIMEVIISLMAAPTARKKAS